MHKYLFIKAERYKQNKQFIKAKEAYLNALSLAKLHGYLHHEAMIAESLADMYTFMNHPNASNKFLQTAIQAYENWGAMAKVDLLKTR